MNKASLSAYYLFVSPSQSDDLEQNEYYTQTAVRNQQQQEPALTGSQREQLIRAAVKQKELENKKQTKPVQKVETEHPAGQEIGEAVPVEETHAVRDPDLNIYTGNPGIYHTEGDTLNFYSITGIPQDTARRDTIQFTIQQPSPPKIVAFEGKSIKSNSTDWPFAILLMGWILFGSLRFGFTKYLGQVFHSIYSWVAAARLYREKGYQSRFGLFRLNLLFYLFLPFSVFLVIRMNDPGTMGMDSFLLFLLLFGALNGYYLLKILFYWLTGAIFSQKEAIGELIFNMMIFNNVMGILLLPIATLHALIPASGMVLQFVTGGIILLFYLLSLWRSFVFAIKEGISIIYLILYLCTLEILPFALLIKLALKG